MASPGCTLLIDVATRRFLSVTGDPELVTAPGSTLKPFVLTALLASGKLRPEESWTCPLDLTLGGHAFTCAHPRTAQAMNVSTALAYSCNNFVAQAARRFAPGELSRALSHAGFAPSRLRTPRSMVEQQMQALGSACVQVTPRDLLLAYLRLAHDAPPAVRDGLEGAVEFGTAQQAQVRGVKVAGKTGTAPGNAAWFAGFAPSPNPKVAVVVLTGGHSGGADAAPIAGHMLAEVFR